MKFKKLVVTYKAGSMGGEKTKTFKDICNIVKAIPDNKSYGSSGEMHIYIEYLGGVCEMSNVIIWEGTY